MNEQQIRAWALLILSIKKRDKTIYDHTTDKKDLERIIKFIQSSETIPDIPIK